MDTTKIQRPDGRSVIICNRTSDFAHQHEAIVKRVSSTTPQPWYAINFDATGTAVGGKTMTQGEVDYLVKAAKDAGLQVSEQV